MAGMELSDHGYEVLLQYLCPADTAALRCVSRSWQALVDRCLTTLQPFAVSTGFFSLNSTPCLMYRSPFQHSSVRHHPLDYGPLYALHAIAGQFTSLHTLSLDCASKACGDFEALRLMKHLRRLHLVHFSMEDGAFKEGLGQCVSLNALHVESQQAMLPLRSLRHLAHLSCLQKLVLRPRGYIHVPPDSFEGVAALAQLTGLTQLVMLTALKLPRHNALGEASALAGPVPDHVPGPAGTGHEGHPLYFSASATLNLSDALGSLRNLKVLRLTGVALLPPALVNLTKLVELSLERVGRVDRAAVASLCCLKALTALTVITATDAADFTTHAAVTALPQQQQQGEGGEALVAANAALGAAVVPNTVYSTPASAAAEHSGAQGIWLPLLELPMLQELVLGSAHRSQQLNLTGNLTRNLRDCNDNFSGNFRAGAEPAIVSQRGGTSSTSTGSSTGSSGSSNGSGWGDGRSGGGSWCSQGGEAISAYVCPTGAWSDLAEVKGLKNIVVVRSWHSAAITAVFPSFAAAVAAFMTWPQVPAAAAAVAVPSCRTLYQHVQHDTQQQVATVVPAPAVPAAGAADSVGSAVGALGVFHNHPNQGCYIPTMPQLTVLAFRPTLGAVGPQHKALVSQLLLQAAGGQQGGALIPGSQQHLPPQHQGLGGWRSQSDSVARCLLLAQLRSSMHHSKLLLVLGASATSLTRLDLTVDQSWPPTVLASLGQLERLKSLSVLKLDCGRQQPAEEMWGGLSRMVSLRWLCLRWLDRLPVAHLAPLTNLVALQLKNIDKPPGVAQLAEVLHGMPHLTALAIEGALLDADEDWLRDMVGLMRHGRWTSSWVEHILCREYRLRVLGSITGALLMSALLNSPRWPEMLVSAFLAAVAGAMFVMAVAASLLQLLFDPRQLRHSRMGLQQYLGYPQQQRQQRQQQQQQQAQEQQAQQHRGQQQQAQQHNMVAQHPVQPQLVHPSQQRIPGDTAAASKAMAVQAVDHGCWGVSSGYASSCSYASQYVSWAGNRFSWFLQFWLLGGWVAAAAQICSHFLPWLSLESSSSSSRSSRNSSEAPVVGLGSGSGGDDSSRGRAEDNSTWLSHLLRMASVHASFVKGVGPTRQDTACVPSAAPPASAAPAAGAAAVPLSDSSTGSSSSMADPAAAGAAGAGRGAFKGADAAAAGPDSAAAAASDPDKCAAGSTVDDIAPSGSSSGISSITDPGSAFRRLQFLSLRRCTLSHSNNSVSNKLWQLSVLASQLAPGWGSQLIAVLLALILWPLAVAAAISRIAATSGSFSRGSNGDGLSSSSGGYSYNRHSKFSAWAWGWDLVCGLLQGAANRVEGAAAGCGPVVAVASCMPELRFLDLTWLNLEPWELQSIVQMKQLHYLGLSRQQVGVVMSREAVFARNCSRNRSHGAYRQRHAAQAAAGVTAQQAVRRRSMLGWLFVAGWYLLFWPLYLWPLRGGWGGGRSEQQAGAGGGGVSMPGVDLLGSFDEWPSMMLVESSSGFDEVIERDFVTS